MDNKQMNLIGKQASKASEGLSVQNLTISYQGKSALKAVTVAIRPGSITGIIGPNGAGKSTFLKSLVGLLKMDSGQVSWQGRPLAKIQRQIAYVEQRSALDLTFPITVEEVVLLGVYPKLGLFNRPKKADKQWAAECLEQVEMSDFAKRQIGELSGGQLQRVFLARALAQKAQIIFLDEPFVGIDLSSEHVIVTLLKHLQKQGVTILIVHHDLHKVEDYFTDLLILNHRVVAAGPVSDVFTTENIKKAYGNVLGEIQIRGVADNGK